MLQHSALHDESPSQARHTDSGLFGREKNLRNKICAGRMGIGKFLYTRSRYWHRVAREGYTLVIEALGYSLIKKTENKDVNTNNSD